MNAVEGDLIHLALNGHFDVIVHGCNCFHTMGAGIANTIRIIFPEAYVADCTTAKGYHKKLGKFSYVTVKRPPMNRITIVNGYTQFHYKGNGMHANYTAIRSVFGGIKALFHDSRIGYPKIGAGLGGGDWVIIKQIIEEELEGEDHTLVIYKKETQEE